MRRDTGPRRFRPRAPAGRYTLDVRAGSGATVSASTCSSATSTSAPGSPTWSLPSRSRPAADSPPRDRPTIRFVSSASRTQQGCARRSLRCARHLAARGRQQRRPLLGGLLLHGPRPPGAPARARRPRCTRPGAAAPSSHGLASPVPAHSAATTPRRSTCCTASPRTRAPPIRASAGCGKTGGARRPAGEPWTPEDTGPWTDIPGLRNWKTWGVPELATLDGMVWYRRSFTLTAAQAAGAATSRSAELTKSTRPGSTAVSSGTRSAGGRRAHTRFRRARCARARTSSS